MAIELFLASVRLYAVGASSWPPFGFMPAGPRLLSYKGRVASFFFFRRKAAEERKGLGRIAERFKSRGCGQVTYHQETRDPQLACIFQLASFTRYRFFFRDAVFRLFFGFFFGFAIFFCEFFFTVFLLASEGAVSPSSSLLPVKYAAKRPKIKS